MLNGLRSICTRCTPRRAAGALLAAAACSSWVAACCTVSSGLLEFFLLFSRILSRTLVTANGSDSITCVAPSPSFQTVAPRPPSKLSSSTAAPSQRGTCQRCMALTIGDRALVISTLMATGMNTTAAQCNTATLANTASSASDTLRTSTGDCHCTGVGSRSGKARMAVGSGDAPDSAVSVPGSETGAGAGSGVDVAGGGIDGVSMG